MFVFSVRDIIKSHSKIILQAAKEFDIDPYLLSNFIDEIVASLHLKKYETNFCCNLLVEMFVGIAQIKLETANDLIKRGLYNPNTDDIKLPFSGNLRKKDLEYLYGYVAQPKHNICFVAAFIRSIVTVWSKYIDLSARPEIIGTLYSQGYGDPKINSTSIKRGDQIASEFYTLAKKWLDL